MEGKNQADQEQSSGKIQGMNNDKGERRSQRKREEREAKEPDLIERHLGGRCLSEAQPAKGQREGNKAREKDPPEDALMSEPAIEATTANKLLSEEIADSTRNERGVASEVGVGKEQLPASFPVAASRRASQPERIFVRHSSHSKNSSYGITDQSRVKPLEATRTESDQKSQDQSSENAIENRASA